MTARPFMPLFVGDYIGDTQHLSRSEHGGYMLLIMAYWAKGGPLPDDDNLLRRITLSTRYAWKKLRKNLQNFFTIRDGKWHHKRIDFELAKIKHKKDLADRNEAPVTPPRVRAPARVSLHTHKGVERSPPTAGDQAAPGLEAPLPAPPDGGQGREPPAVGEGIIPASILQQETNRWGEKAVRRALLETERRRHKLLVPIAYFRTVCKGRAAGISPAVHEKTEVFLPGEPCHGPRTPLTDEMRAEILAMH